MEEPQAPQAGTGAVATLAPRPDGVAGAAEPHSAGLDEQLRGCGRVAPFNPRWYSGELVFIVEPVLLVVLSLALLLPLVFSLADSEMGVRRSRFRGRGLAAAALAVMVGLWVWRYDLHASAVHIAEGQQLSGGEVLRASQSPYPVNPYQWHTVVETPNNFTTGTTDTRLGVMELDQVAVAKPATTLETLAAKHSLLGRVYLDWSKYPVVDDLGPASEIYPDRDLSPRERAAHVVRFHDLRFGYDVWGFKGRGSNALAGEGVGGRRSGSDPAELWRCGLQR